MKKIIFALLLCSCTYGIGSIEPEQNNETYPSVKTQLDPIQHYSSEEPIRNCVVKTTQVDNCILTQVWCMDDDEGYKLVDVDVSCFNSRQLFH
jgi:hypothetical protein